MLTRDKTDDVDAVKAVQEIDKILLKDCPGELDIKYMIDALVKYKEMRVFIAERIVKIPVLIEDKMLKLLLESDDQDLIVHCSLILMFKGNKVGSTCR